MGLKCRSRRGGVEKSPDLCRESNRGRTVRSLVIILSELALEYGDQNTGMMYGDESLQL
jgi:hypothetical protein